MHSLFLQQPRSSTAQRVSSPALILMMLAVIGTAVAQDEAVRDQVVQDEVARDEVAEQNLSVDGKPLAARVNGEDITLGELTLAVNQYVITNRLRPDSGISIPKIQKTVLDRLIANQLVRQRARELDLPVLDEEVSARLDALRAQVGSPEDFRLMLTVQNLTEALLRDQLSGQIAAEKVIDAEVFADMEFRDRDVKAHYEKHKAEFMSDEQVLAGHIVVRLRPDMTDEERSAAREKIDAIKVRLDAGEDFEGLAVEQSEDSAAASGGDLGWVSKSAISGPFQVVAFSLAEGETSDVVATDFSYHIIQVRERRPEMSMPLETARPMIEERLREERLPTAVRAYLARLRAEATVETFIEVDG